MIFKFRTELIKEYMEKNNLTPKEFCERCGISLYAYKKVINNAPDVGSLSAKVLYNLATQIGVSTENLIIHGKHKTPPK